MIEITTDVLSLDRCVRAVESAACGAIVTFSGTVRDHSGDLRTDYLEYEAYAEMAEETLRAIVDEAKERWSIGDIAVQHRLGRLEIGEASVVIAVSAGHRAEAFAACRHVIERLKEIVPIWKKEYGPDGSMWVGGPTAIAGSSGPSAGGP